MDVINKKWESTKQHVYLNKLFSDLATTSPLIHTGLNSYTEGWQKAISPGDVNPLHFSPWGWILCVLIPPFANTPFISLVPYCRATQRSMFADGGRQICIKWNHQCWFEFLTRNTSQSQKYGIINNMYTLVISHKKWKITMLFKGTFTISMAIFQG